MRHRAWLGPGWVGAAWLAASLLGTAAWGESIATWAGTGTAGYAGDGGSPALARLAFPSGVWGDSAGAVFVADTGNHRIRRVNSAGDTITTVAGTGTAGFAGDGGAATAAPLNGPAGVFVDSTGSVYIADTGNHRVRRITGTTIATIAGTGTAGYSGDDSAATNARLNAPSAVFVRGGVVYIADTGNHRIRKVTGTTISTVAGTGVAGYSGDDSVATRSQLSSPSGVVVDAAGSVYIADTGNHRIRKVTGTTIATIAGNGLPGYAGDGDLPTRARLSYPKAVCLDSAGAVYIADNYNHRIRRINPAGNIATVAGTGVVGYGGDTTAAYLSTLSSPSGVFVDRRGRLYLADTGNQRLRRLSATDARGLTGTNRVAPGDQARVLSVAFTGDGTTGITSVGLTVSDLSSATGVTASDFSSLRLYESADSLLDGADLLVGSLSGTDLILGRVAIIQANPVRLPANGARRYYLVGAQLAASATQGHAFKVGCDPGCLATSKGGQGGRVAARDTDRMDVDVVATRLIFSTQPGGAISTNPLQTQPVVTAVDDSGRTDASFTDIVTLTTTGPGSVLGNQATASGGVATFTRATYLATADKETFSLTADDQATGAEGDLPPVTSKALVANAQNTAPRVELYGMVMREDVPFTTTIASVVTDPEDSVFTFAFVSHHLRGSTAGGQLTITPETNWYGLDTLTVIAADPFGAQGRATAVFEVTPVDDPPILSLPDTLTFLEDDSLRLDLLARVRDPDTPLSLLKWSVSPSPGLRMAFDAGTAQLTLRAPPDSSGTYRLLVEVSDLSFNTARDTVVVSVWPVNDPPVVSLPDTSMPQGSALSLDLGRFASDRDHAVGQLRWSASSRHLGAAASASGNLTLTPDAGFYGVDSLVVTATDPGGAAGRDTALVRVARVDRPPSLRAIPDTTVRAGASLSWDLRVYASDPDDPLDSLAWAASGSRRSQVAMQGSVLRLVAASGSAYAETLRVAVRDPSGLTAADTLVVRAQVAPRLVAGLPDTSFAPGDSVRLPLDRYVAGWAQPAGLSWAAQGGVDLRIAVDAAARVAVIAGRAGWKGQARVVLIATTAAGESGSDTLLATVLNPAPAIDLPALYLDPGASTQLSLDSYARDDEPVSRLTWSAQPDPGIQVSINRALRQATLTASVQASGRVAVVFRAVDLQGAAAVDTALVNVHASGDTTAGGGALPDTTGAPADTTAGDGALPDTTGAPADTTATPPDSTGNGGTSPTGNQPPVLGRLPSISLAHGASTQLSLDGYVRDEAPIAALTWTARADSGLGVAVDPSRRVVTVTAVPGFAGRARLVLQVADGYGATATGTVWVSVLAAPAGPVPGDFDGNGRPDLQDFFRLVDRIGLNALHPNWDPRFDLDGDGAITIDDFFLFADRFEATRVPAAR